MPSTYTLISSNVLASSASSVTFSAIPSTYTDLIVRASVRDLSTNAIGETLAFRINGDSSTSYSRRRIEGVGSSVSSGGWSGENYSYTGVTNGGGTTANTFDSYELYLPNYTTSASKQFSTYCVTESNSASNNVIDAYAALWTGTSAITSLTFYEIGTANFAAGSSFYLYGIKNS